MKQEKPSVAKFSLAEMTSNTSGKTSASGTMGSLLVAIGGFTFLFSVVGFFFFKLDIEGILIQCIALCYAGAALLGYRKSRGSIDPVHSNASVKNKQQIPTEER